MIGRSPGFHGSAAQPTASAKHTDAHLLGPCGAAGAYRRAAWEDVGGLDDGVVSYGEDVDLALRLRAGTWRTVGAPDAVAVHLGSATARKRSAWQRYQAGFSRAYFLRRYAVLRFERRTAHTAHRGGGRRRRRARVFTRSLVATWSNRRVASRARPEHSAHAHRAMRSMQRSASSTASGFGATSLRVLRCGRSGRSVAQSRERLVVDEACAPSHVLGAEQPRDASRGAVTEFGSRSCALAASRFSAEASPASSPGATSTPVSPIASRFSGSRSRQARVHEPSPRGARTRAPRATR